MTDNHTRTVDLRAMGSPSELFGRMAVWTDDDGTDHEGVIAPDPSGTDLAVVQFEDGTHGRTGGVVELVEEWTHLPALDGTEPQSVGIRVTVAAGAAEVAVCPLLIDGQGLSVEVDASTAAVPAGEVEGFLEAFNDAVRQAAGVIA